MFEHSTLEAKTNAQKYVKNNELGDTVNNSVIYEQAAMKKYTNPIAGGSTAPCFN